MVRVGTSLAIPLSLLTVSALLVSFDPEMAMARCVAASLGYGLRTVLVQLHNFEERDQITRLCHVDSLTGIPNRRRFDDVLRREWARRDRASARFALLMIDIDHFRQLNDHFGHLVGDERLRNVAVALAQCARHKADLVARHGGEEFAVILPDADAYGARIVAERMRAKIECLSLASGSGPGVVTVSIGLVCAQPHDTDLSAFVASARASHDPIIAHRCLKAARARREDRLKIFTKTRR